jgi:hypothetical protein
MRRGLRQFGLFPVVERRERSSGKRANAIGFAVPGGDHMRGAIIVRRTNLFLRTAIIIVALALAGCGHKLVAHGGDTTVPVFPDKASFERLKNLQSQGGPAGMIGGLGASLVAKKVDNGTPVKIVTSDEDGCQIEVLDGASKGLEGYVSKDSVD